MSELDRPDSGQDNSLCTCGHFAAQHMWFSEHPCGFGRGCHCPAFTLTDVSMAESSGHDPALARVLAEVAAEVQPGLGLTGLGWSRSELIAFAADCLTRVLAIDAAAGDQ